MKSRNWFRHRWLLLGLIMAPSAERFGLGHDARAGRRRHSPRRTENFQRNPSCR